MRKIAIVLMFFVGIITINSQVKRSKNNVQVSSRVTSSNVTWCGYIINKSETFNKKGTVKMDNGVFNFKDGNFIDAEFSIDMNSLSIENEEGDNKIKWTNDLKSTNFFDVKNYPKVYFHISKIIPKTNNDGYNSLIVGELTIKDKRKSISFPANVIFDRTSVRMETSKITINRKDYNIFFNPGIKDFVIKDEMDIQVKLATK
jgi:polyisoprenoid-binding protein YceI